MPTYLEGFNDENHHRIMTSQPLALKSRWRF